MVLLGIRRHFQNTTHRSTISLQTAVLLVPLLAAERAASLAASMHRVALSLVYSSPAVLSSAPSLLSRLIVIVGAAAAGRAVCRPPSITSSASSHRFLVAPTATLLAHDPLSISLARSALRALFAEPTPASLCLMTGSTASALPLLLVLLRVHPILTQFQVKHDNNCNIL